MGTLKMSEYIRSSPFFSFGKEGKKNTIVHMGNLGRVATGHFKLNSSESVIFLEIKPGYLLAHKDTIGFLKPESRSACRGREKSNSLMVKDKGGMVFNIPKEHHRDVMLERLHETAPKEYNIDEALKLMKKIDDIDEPLMERMKDLQKSKQRGAKDKEDKKDSKKKKDKKSNKS